MQANEHQPAAQERVLEDLLHENYELRLKVAELEEELAELRAAVTRGT